MSALGPSLSSSPLTAPAGIAVVGAGAFGRFSIDAYRTTTDLRVIAVADPDPAAREQVEVLGTRVVADWQQVVGAQEVEVVHVATPPHLRSEIVFAALQAGKSVFCEKPLALSLAEADAMIATALEAGVTLGVDYVMRHQDAYRILESIAASRILGEIRTISFQNFAQSLSSDHWFWDRTKSGGIFVEHGVHFFDAYSRVAGAPHSISGTVPRREAVEATVTYSGGVVGRYFHEFSFPLEIERTLGTSFFQAGYVEIEGWIPQRLYGAAFGIDVDRLAQLLDGSGVRITNDESVTRFAVSFEDRAERYAQAVVAGMRDMVRSHRDPTFRMTVPVEDARESLRVALACQHAATDGTDRAANAYSSTVVAKAVL